MRGDTSEDGSNTLLHGYLHHGHARLLGSPQALIAGADEMPLFWRCEVSLVPGRTLDSPASVGSCVCSQVEEEPSTPSRSGLLLSHPPLFACSSTPQNSAVPVELHVSPLSSAFHVSTEWSEYWLPVRTPVSHMMRGHKRPYVGASRPRSWSHLPVLGAISWAFIAKY